MGLNSRERVFLQYLLEEIEYKPLSYYAKKMNVTVRTLRSDLKGIEYYLNNLGIKLEKKSGIGIYLDHSSSEKAALYLKLMSGRKYDSYITPVERRAEILRRLLHTTSNALSVQKLSENFFVSPSSIVNDLKYVEKWLNIHGLELLRDASGTRVKGSEILIRKAIAAYIEENEFENTVHMQNFNKERVDNVYLENLMNVFSERDIYFLDKLLNSLENQCGYLIGEQYYTNLLIYLLIAIERISKGCKIDTLLEKLPEETCFEFSYRLAGQITRQIEKYLNMELGQEEKIYIYQYLASFGMGSGIEPSSEKGQMAEKVAEEIILWVTKAMKADFTSDNNLGIEFKNYIYSMLNRLQFNVDLNNRLLPGIRQLYPELFAYLNGVMWCLTDIFGINMVSQDEIAFISMYCQVAVNTAQKHPRVLIVCQSGYGTSQLLVTRLIQAFPNLEIAGVVSAGLLRGMDLSKYNFIISTVRLQALPIPYIVISPLLMGQDIEKIKDSGLLSENRSIGNSEDSLDKDFLEECLEIEEDSLYWNTWIKQNEKEQAENMQRLSGGKLEVILIRNSGKRNVIILKENRSDIIKAVIFGKNSKDILSLLARYYRMVVIGKHFFCSNADCRESDFLYSVLPPSHIVTGQNFESKEEVIRYLAEILFEQKAIVDVEGFCREVFAREMEGMTAIEEDVALPHGQAQTMALAMALLPSAILWGECEGETIQVRIVVLFAVNSKDAYRRDSDYFRILSIIGRVTDSFKKRERLLQAENGERVLEILTRLLRDEEEDI